MRPVRYSIKVAAFLTLLGACEPASKPSRQVDSSHVVASPTPAGEIHATGAFAFSDSSGARLLAVDSVSEPATITAALCSGGRALSIRYEKTQVQQPGDNGRQIAANFFNQPGQVFSVVGSKAAADRTCYLSRDQTLISAANAVSMRKPADCPASLSSRVAAARHREVIHCWSIASTSTGRDVLAVQFANVDTSALATLVIVDDILRFRDFPAVYNALEQSTWRVDDGGVFSPAGFDIIFSAAMPYGYVLAFTWAGAEGESSELVVSDSSGVFRTVQRGYRYWSPS